MPTLTIQLPGFPPVSHVLKDETITIGRMKGNTIVIEDASISLMHAKITRKDGQFYLKDLNSTNGTIVNGQPVTEARLRDLDWVRFADISGQFLSETAPQPATSPVLTAPVPAVPVQVTGLPPGIPAPISAMPAPQTSASSGARPAPVASAATTRPRINIFPWLAGATALAVAAFFGWKFLAQNRLKQSSPERAVALATESRQPADRRIEALAPKTAVNSLVGTTKPATQSSTDSVDQLAKALKKSDVAERRRAASALHSLGPDAKPATDALRDALKDDDAEVQMWAALTLVNNQSYDKAAIPVLVGVLQHENTMLRQLACLSLGLMPYDGAEKDLVIPALAETAGKDTDEDVRKAAKSALGIIAPELLGKTDK